jgi:hypothetical protein
MASKVKKHGRKLNAVEKMKFVHLREGSGSNSVCGHSGVHTSKRSKRVNCPHCTKHLEQTNGC